MNQVIDTVTGEIVEDAPENRFYDLDTCEQELFESMGEELSAKIKQIRLLHIINQRQLYRQRLDDDGNALQSMRQYVKSIAPKLDAIGLGKERSLLSWLVRYRVYIDQLQKPESFLQELGSHAEVMLPAAARFEPTSELLEDDEQTENGKRLGKENFRQLVEEIEEKVRDSVDSDVGWTVNDTREYVADIIGKQTEPKPKYAAVAKWVTGEEGVKVKVTDFGIWLNDFYYKIGDIIPVDHFKLIGKSWRIDGLGDSWRD